MIVAYTGKTGSGKTYMMVYHAFRYWKQGWNIYSNTILFFNAFKGYSLIVRGSKWLCKKLFSRLGYKGRIGEGKIVYFQEISEILDARDAIILFDEGQVLFNARNWESLPDDFSYKIQQHRKHGLHLFVTCQSLGTIDINYRRLIQKWYHCEDRIALFGIRNPSLLSLHTWSLKDVDYLYEVNTEVINVPDVQRRLFIIHRWKRRLYDTLYDIGFHRFKVIWTTYKEQKRQSRRWMIIPKKMTSQQATRVISSSRAFHYGPTRSKNFTKASKNS
jgi:hypothetical protein